MTEIQTSKYTYINDNTNAIVDKVSLRVNWITGFQTSRKHDEFNEGNDEDYEDIFVRMYNCCPIIKPKCNFIIILRCSLNVYLSNYIQFELGNKLWHWWPLLSSS